MIKKILDSFFSTRASGIYILLFAAAIAVATFVENDFGTSAAQKLIFRAWWFEALLTVFGISILVNIFRFKMIKQRKWAILLFHVAIIIILIGAGVTRYFGSEGRMHIREGSSSNEIISNESFLRFRVKPKNGKSYSFEEPVYFASIVKNKFNKSYQIADQLIQLDLVHFLPNPTEDLVDDPGGQPVIKVVISGEEGREEYFLKEKEIKNLHHTVFNFGNEELPNAINILYQDRALLIKTADSLTQFQMASQRTDMLAPGTYHPLLVRTLYTAGDLKFVIGDFKPNAKLATRSSSVKMKNESTAALQFAINVNGVKDRLLIYGNPGSEGDYQFATVSGTEVGISYGSKKVRLPFYIQLHDFILDRYPGTNSPSSYASEVSLSDERNNFKKDHRIYMNHVLDYDGYRFFQSSFDQDELGTVLSVNHDAWGTRISYFGYFLLTIGMVWTLLSRNSRFRTISEKLKSMRSGTKPLRTGMAILMLTVGYLPSVFGYVNMSIVDAVDKKHAKQFGQLTVQDQQGRMKPMNSLSSEILRKLSRKEVLYGQNPDQVVLGMMAYPEEWTKIPVIKIGDHEEIRKLLDVTGPMAAYNDFFKPEYVLRDAVMAAYNREPRDRTVEDKELIRLDEKVNICNLVFSGRLMQWFPVQDDKNHSWISPADPSNSHGVNESGQFKDNYYFPYLIAVRSAMESKNWKEPQAKLEAIASYQQTYGGAVLISPNKINMEILLNKMNVFSKLSKYYGLLGVLILILFFFSVFNPAFSLKWPLWIAAGSLGICFFFHTLGLGLRWYVSGRAPWSNGYESMIYIAFTTVLSGLLFSRKSLGGLAATSILASTILMVAGLSWMDPEITPLVPVLKSYWLTIHVSLEAGSYGFLTLGALIGVLNLVLMIFSTPANKDRISRTINELTLTSEMTLIAGLFIISIGTYLGGVWANESWGRYWGWDAKETWALVTILVYAFILHMRFIPGLRGVYAFNLASLFGFASVMMTYFGVNYYLSGLHSYAAGDPVPVPSFVYYTVSGLALVSVLALWKYKKLNKLA